MASRPHAGRDLTIGPIAPTLLAFAPSPRYATHAARAEAHGVDPLADQQLAGLLMWIPAGVVLLAACLGLFAAWLGEARRRSRSLEAG